MVECRCARTGHGIDQNKLLRSVAQRVAIPELSIFVKPMRSDASLDHPGIHPAATPAALRRLISLRTVLGDEQCQAAHRGNGKNLKCCEFRSCCRHTRRPRQMKCALEQSPGFTGKLRRQPDAAYLSREMPIL